MASLSAHSRAVGSLLTLIVLFAFAGDRLFDIDSGIGMPLRSPASVHFTMLFNIFVLMTLFNEINARKINGERNVFQGLCSNWIFCAIFFTTSILQVCVSDEQWQAKAMATCHRWPTVLRHIGREGYC